MLLGTLGASLLLTGKRLYRTGKGMYRTGKGMYRSGQGLKKINSISSINKLQNNGLF